MPAITPYPTAETVLNVARAAMADAGVDPISGLIVGDVFTDDRPGTLVTLQAAYDWAQSELANNGVETFAKTTIIQNVPATATTDPGLEVHLSFTGYFDGVNNNAAPILPGDLRIPLLLGQRQAGVPNAFMPVDPANDGLSSRAKTTYLTEWEWRGDAIYTQGALLALDWKLRYIPYLPKLTLAGGGQQNLLVLNCENAVGYKAAALFAASVGGEGAGTLEEQAKGFLEQMVVQTSRKQQRGNHRRIPYSARRGRGRRF
jgi:hypothetical protein